MARLWLALLLSASLLAGCAPLSLPGTVTKVGALFPLTGSQATLGREQLEGVRLAQDFANADHVLPAGRIELLVRDLHTREEAEARVTELQRGGADAVIGAYSSGLSLPASEAAAAHGLLYWEAGATADQITGRALPLVFRVGATNRNLGALATHFAADVLAPRLRRTPAQIPIVTVEEREAYGASVAQAAVDQAAREGIPVARRVTFDANRPDWPSVLEEVRAARPSILLLVANIPDGVSFRRAMLASGLRVDALIGSTMAQCLPAFGALLGADAVGVFAADRPTAGFNPEVLDARGRAAYERLARAYRARHQRPPSEEALAGFSAAWVLFYEVIPGASRAHDLNPNGLARVARALDLADGSLANGAGVRFADTPDALGQNLRAAGVVWQWQGVRRSVTVYPPVFATGAPVLIPLPR